MGQIIRAECPDCGFHTDLFAGGGRSDCDRETMLGALQEPERGFLAAAFARGATASIFRKCAQCSVCGRLSALAVVEYRERENSATLYGHCPGCGRISYMDLSGQTRAAQRCPECGGDLTLTPCGHWD